MKNKDFVLQLGGEPVIKFDVMMRTWMMNKAELIEPFVAHDFSLRSKTFACRGRLPSLFGHSIASHGRHGTPYLSAEVMSRAV